MKVLITIWKDTVSPRFDLSPEVILADLGEGGEMTSKKTLVLPTVSAEELCNLVLAEGVDLVITGGIEGEYYDYLTWKKVEVIDSVIGSYEEALSLAGKKALEPGAILLER